MKKMFLLAVLFIGLIASPLFSQSATTANTVTKTWVYTPDEKGFETLTAVVFKITFTADSLLAQATPVLEVPEYLGVNVTDYPPSFRLKQVGTHGIPASDIYLQGLFASTTDTVTIDTISATTIPQTEADTVAVLDLKYGVKPALGAYKVYIRVRTADVHSGTLQITFPIPIEARIRKDPKRGTGNVTITL